MRNILIVAGGVVAVAAIAAGVYFGARAPSSPPPVAAVSTPNKAALESVQPGAGGEIQLTDGIAALLQEEQLLAYRFNGIRYDCGSKLGYLQAQVAFGLKHEELRSEFAEYLKTIV